MQTVHIRVNDAATGQPTPARLRVTDADGRYWSPFGRPADVPHGKDEAVGGSVVLDRKAWAYIDGACEIAVPPGDLTVEIAKGPEWKSLRETINLVPGKMALRFAIERLVDSRKDGWHSGDLRAHSLSPHAACLEAAAEDLDVVHVLSAATPILASDGHSYITYPHILEFSGQGTALDRDGHRVAVGTLNSHPVLGQLALHHCHRVVYPLAFGGGDATDDWSLADWCEQCHRKRGLVVWIGAALAPVGHAAEALANAILGQIDAFELTPDRPEGLQVWYQLLQAGVRLPLVGASAKRSNAVALGTYRTYARLDEPFTMSAWIEAIRAGRTVASSGPMLRLAIDDTTAVATLDDDEKVEILMNGHVVAAAPNRASFTFRADSAGWIAARSVSAKRKRSVVHTSAIALPQPATPDPGAVSALRRHLDSGRAWVEIDGRFEQPKSRTHLLEVFDAAIAKLSSG